MEKAEKDTKDLTYLRRYARLLDSSIPIPGTNRTIGIAPIIGLVSMLEDIISCLFSTTLVMQPLTSQPSPVLSTKIMANITLDAVLGMASILGSIYDFVYKENERNYHLLI
jgi:hypothetical protein